MFLRPHTVEERYRNLKRDVERLREILEEDWKAEEEQKDLFASPLFSDTLDYAIRALRRIVERADEDDVLSAELLADGGESGKPSQTDENEP